MVRERQLLLAMGLMLVACGEGPSVESATLSDSGATGSPPGGFSDVPTSGATDGGGLTTSAQGSESMTGVDPSTATATDATATSGPPDPSGTGAATATNGATTSGTDTAGETASASATDTAGDTGAATGGESGADTGAPECVSACEDGKVHACGDCLDNDGDGASDCDDPDCFGPCDDSEEELGSPLEGKDPCKQDCYFDGDAGQGGGDCQWNLKCDPLAPGPAVCPYNPNLDPDEPDDLTDDYGKCVDGDPSTCADHCSPPNGCDCFGCCTVGDVDLFIGSPGCSSDDLSPCKPCTKQDALCGNPCDDGEVCYPDIEPGVCGAPG